MSVLVVLSDRDILWALSRTTKLAKAKLIEIMTREPFTVRSGTLLMDAVATMVTKHINCLPVVNDDGSVCGILTSTDLLKSFQTVLGWLPKKRSLSGRRKHCFAVGGETKEGSFGHYNRVRGDPNVRQ